MKIIQKSRIEVAESYSLVFVYKGDKHGSGYAFDCDAEGNVATPAAEAGRENLRRCLAGEVEVEAPYVETHVHRRRVPRIGECDCGAHVYLTNFTNSCGRCGTDYNMSGQRLAPRECWGEETGEHWTECV